MTNDLSRTEACWRKERAMYKKLVFRWASADFSHDVLPLRYILLVCSFGAFYKQLSRYVDDISKLKH